MAVESWWGRQHTGDIPPVTQELETILQAVYRRLELSVPCLIDVLYTLHC